MSEGAILQLDQLSRGFGALVATDAVSLSLLPGEIHALIGPNGAGKSTLIKLVAGELAPDSGHIVLEGRRIDALGEVSRVQRGLVRTFQVSQLMPELSVLQHVVLARQSLDGNVFRLFGSILAHTRHVNDARDVLHRVGLADRETVTAAALSHGERRRLELALALALQPRVLLLDEPMAGLGADGSEALSQVLDRVRHRVPVLLVEHDMDVVFSLSDRVSVLDYGRIIATGTADEVRAHPEVMRAYLGTES